MKISAQSHNSIVTSLKKALEKYASLKEKKTVTDIYLQPQMGTGELSVLDDDDEVLASTLVKEWAELNPEDFYVRCEQALKRILNQMNESGEFASLQLVKPYSFVLVDQDKETMSELLIVDEEETLFLNDELLKGLDEELNAFLKDLLEN